MITDIKYDDPIPVSEEKWKYIREQFSGIIAWRKDEATGQYYIKLWFMKYKKELLQVLNA